MSDLEKKDTKFPKGVSGNPAGRPKGSKNKTTLIKQAIEGDLVEQLQESAPAIMQKAIEKALKGDAAMIKLIIERLVPIRKAAEEDERSGTPKIVISVSQYGKDDNQSVTIEGETLDGEEE